MQVLVSAFDSDASLNVLDHPILDFVYYMVFYSVFLLYVSCHYYFGIDLSTYGKLHFAFKIQVVEILPSALVLFILRKLPPKRISAQYHDIR
jgi:hypothetical protein